MDATEFRKNLDEAHDLMMKEKYKEAIIILDKLKEIDKKGDFDYALTHELYQLLSNSISFYNQQIILTTLNNLASEHKSITFDEVINIIKETTDLEIENSIIQREIELLVLRNLFKCKIEGNMLKFE